MNDTHSNTYQYGQRRTRLRLFTLSIFAAVSLALTACVPAPGKFPDTPDLDSGNGHAGIAEELRPYYGQQVSWEKCHSKFECATVKAPMDWENPGANDIELAVIKYPARSGKPIGTLFTNPGGPGGSGVDFVINGYSSVMSQDLRENFDIMSWDPRGVGQSSAVKCFASDEEKNTYLYEDLLQIKEGEPGYFDAVQELFQDIADHCAKHTGELLGFVDTVSTVNDLDMLRYLAGDEKLHYLGFSYGAYMGAIYAEEFPQNVGRVVLDGPVAPDTDIVEINYYQAQGFEDGLEQYLEWCIGGDDPDGFCPFMGRTVEQSKEALQDMLKSLDAQPMKGSDGRSFTGDSFAMAMIAGLYSTMTWPFLSTMIMDVFGGDVDNGFVLIDYYDSRNPDGSFMDNSYEANMAVNCLDYPSIADPNIWQQNLDAVSQVAPVFGPYFGYAGGLCSKWPVPSTVDRVPVTAAGSQDILVVGNVHDTATPYTWAENLAQQLENGHLLTREGQGHTSYGLMAPCTTEAVDAYLIDGKVPAPGTFCVE